MKLFEIRMRSKDGTTPGKLMATTDYSDMAEIIALAIANRLWLVDGVQRVKGVSYLDIWRDNRRVSSVVIGTKEIKEWRVERNEDF